MKRNGITLIELLIALSIMSIAMSGFTYLVVSNMRFNASSGLRTQAAQILNYLGRRAISGDAPVLPTAGLTTRSWNYGSLTTAFSDLTNSGNLANPNLFKASVNNLGPWSNADSTVTLQRYQVVVCWKSSNTGSEECVRGSTLGPVPLASGVAPPLPGLN